MPQQKIKVNIPIIKAIKIVELLKLANEHGLVQEIGKAVKKAQTSRTKKIFP
tara:strand:- start:1332 stop:1487 length:156 start_codon:yes stop_codon:yes gene_type:complete